jgi:hypothetical protein
MMDRLVKEYRAARAFRDERAEQAAGEGAVREEALEKRR